MSAQLLFLSVGPVQEFIAAARRTRDLWFGSHLLSEISKAVAAAVRDEGGGLIFPAEGSDLTEDSDLNVANNILAELPEGVDPRTVAAKAKDAARRRWREGFADQVLRDYWAVIRTDLWEGQVDDVVEFYAVRVPFTDATYAGQRRRLVRLMAGRKNCRDFLPAEGREGVPKSSLDGLRETVLKEDRLSWPPSIRRRLRVRDGEQLDVVGLVKRTAEGHRPYPSVSRIAADPWLRGVAATETGGRLLADLNMVCKELADDECLHRIDTESLHKDFERFPYEGTAVYRSRHPELHEEAGFGRDRGGTSRRFGPLENALKRVEDHAREAGLGKEPDPYLAVLVADGDRMGKVISELTSPQQHRDFSKELSRFAGQARDIVCKHHGVLVYAGGDDVLAFLPVDQCLPCAHALHEDFGRTMDRALANVGSKRPTLSVGIALGHFMENLEDLLDYGRAAEKAAKGPDRDGLAVHLHKRGGGPVRVRRQWDTRLDDTLTRYAAWFLTGAVSNRTPYELAHMADIYDGWPSGTIAKAIQGDAIRVIDRKRPTGSASAMDKIREELEGRRHIGAAGDLRGLANELLVARQFAVAFRQSGRVAGKATEEGSKA